MSEALYRKYRSKTLDEVVGQDHITTTLKNAIKNKNISHAYLLSGPRGVGKTSVARIIAHEINNFKYNGDDNYLDIIEIDAASNSGVENIRQLVDRVNLSPAMGKYKVFIIDEVHMLSKPAFNALLKTLEEPPEYIVFILATTETHKVPETILSRTQQFSFRPISNVKIIDQLKMISKAEEIKINDDALRFIAEYGGGSFRESIGLLDQASNLNKTITLEQLELIVGSAPKKIIDDMVCALEEKSIKSFRITMQSINDNGYAIDNIAKQLISALKDKIIEQDEKIEVKDNLKLIDALLKLASSSDPSVALEITVYSYIFNNEREPAPIKEIHEEEKPTQTISKNHPKLESKEQFRRKKIKVDTTDLWPKVIDEIRAQYPTLYSIAKMTVANFEDNNLTLKTKFAFHQRSLNDVKNRQIIESILKKITNVKFNIEIVVDGSITTKTEENILDVNSEEDIKTISNIFGGVEVIE
ncbi:MAG TPA: DNA polymerase III subunit gamma/tau [Candidatus Saccharimonadia bacterium]|nr:DNA polymerase III subunit gamma/tau [Candidatus Saccharimonadia bacterium]